MILELYRARFNPDHLAEMFTDVRHAFRSLARNRGFSLVIILTLGLGIGSAASIFSVADGTLFGANRFPENIYLIGGHSSRNPSNPFRYDFMVQAYQEQVSAIADYAVAKYQTGNVAVSNQPVASAWIDVSQNFFELLEITPAQGRTFLSSEDTAGSDQVVVVSYQFWNEHLGAHDNVLGSKIIVGGTVCSVVGVLRQGQAIPAYLSDNVYRPLVFRVGPPQPSSPQLSVLGRLRSGVTREQAEQALGAAKFDLPAQMKDFFSDDRPALSGLANASVRRREVLWVMLGAVGFLYAIACLNASNLILVRLLGQRRELSVRLALGGGRWRIIRLMAVETAALSILGSLAGLLVANWFFPLLLSAAGPRLGGPQWAPWSVSWRMAGLMALLTIVTNLFILAIPALRILRADISSGLKDGGAALGESRSLARLRGLFVVLQAAFAVVLLAGAGLMIRTFHQLHKVELGFDSAGRVKLSIGFPTDYPGNQELRLNRLREIQAELRRVPGVEAAAFGSDVLLPGYFFQSLHLEGPEGRPMAVSQNIIQIGYQDVAGLRLKRGRWLSRPTSDEVMVSETFAKNRWPDSEPVGQLIKPVDASGGSGWMVVGVVGDVRSTMRDAPGPAMYVSEGFGGFGAMGMNTFILKLSGNYDETFAGTIRRKLYEFDSRIVVQRILPVTGLQESQLWLERTTNSVLKVLAGIALLLTVVGVFSMLAYTVDRRMGEFGVRMALGATRRNLVRLVMQRSVLLTASGVLIGLCCTLMLTRFLRSQLFETSPNDPWVLGGVGAILLITAVLASALPAWRATQVNISKLLHSE